MIHHLGDNLIFLISQPRAGSTLLQRILAGHPEIYTTGEPWIMLHILYALKREGISSDFNSQWARHALDNFSGIVEGGEDVYIEAIRKMALHLYDTALVNTDKRYFLDKTPRYYFIIPELYKVFPNAKYIVLLRNPLSVLSSILENWVKDEWQNLINFKHDLLKAPQLIADGIDALKDNAIVVRYEKIVANPEQKVKFICERLHVDFDSAMLSYGNNPVPEWKMGDQGSIQKHTGPVQNYKDTWIEKLATQKHRFLAELYLSVLGSELLARLGYSYEQLYKDLLSIPCIDEHFDRQAGEQILVNMGLSNHELAKNVLERYLRCYFKGCYFKNHCEKLYQSGADLSELSEIFRTEKIVFGIEDTALYLRAGWSHDEKLPEGCTANWALRESASLFLSLPKDKTILLTANVQSPKFPNPQIVTIKIDNQEIGKWKLSGNWQWEQHSMLINPDNERKDVSMIEFAFSQSTTIDNRDLAVLFESITFS